MDRLTHVEVHQLEELLRSEHAAAAKCRMYAALANETGDEGVTKLCEQLADRHREHFIALMRQISDSDTRISH